MNLWIGSNLLTKCNALNSVVDGAILIMTTTARPKIGMNVLNRSMPMGAIQRHLKLVLQKICHSHHSSLGFPLF